MVDGTGEREIGAEKGANLREEEWGIEGERKMTLSLPAEKETDTETATAKGSHQVMVI